MALSTTCYFQTTSTHLSNCPVIQIIAILAAMLLPALNQARERGRAIACVSQMRQLGQYFMLYADENDGCMFTHNIYINPTTTYAWGQWWNLILKSPPYTKTIEKMLQCPSRDQSIVFNVFGNGYDYGINGYFSVYSPGSAPWARMQRIKHPSRKAQLMESQKGQRFTMAIATMEPQFRHLNSQSNVLFVDGHMSDWQKAELTMDNTKPPWDYVDGQTGK